MRRTPLKPGTKPLRRKTPLREVSPKRAAASGEPVRPRDTGPDRTTRDLCAERDLYACVRCGRQLLTGPKSLQHRLARGLGGTSNAALSRPSNLIWLCGSATTPGGCHLAAESRSEETRIGGWWVPSWQNPADVPVLHSQYGPVLLLDDGQVELLGEVA